VSFQYGYIEARIATPVGGANWPAFWMLGDNITTVAWPNSGEIDIMEGKGATPSLSTGAAHYNLDPSGCCGGNRYIDGLTSTGAPFPGNWHTYAIAWKPGWMQFLVDETPFLTVDRTTAGITYWPFDAPFFAILNNAIGPAGGFGGNYDGWAQSRMLVDYVRAFQFDGYGVVTTHP
jgi:beta-glucanase (GH16 family)